jgi:putative transposase
MDTKQVVEEFRLSDELWERMKVALPEFRRSKKGGRPRLGWRQVVDGIFYVLRTGCQWKAVPPQFGSGSSLHRYFQLLVKRNVFRTLWAMALLEYDDLKGIEWRWQSMDGAMTKAPLGGEKHGSEPDRPRQAGHQEESAHRRQRRAAGYRNQCRQYA